MYSYNPYYEKYLAHYGTPKHSGRYPWGSGKRPHQHDSKSSSKNRGTKKESVLATYAIVYGGTAVIALAGYGMQRLHGKIKDTKVSKILNQNAGEIDKKSGLPKKTVEYTDKEDIKMINPGFGNGKKTTRNCSNCSIVYDLRKRGYEVSAGLRDHGRFTDEIAGMYKNAKLKTVEKDPNKKIEFQSSYIKRLEQDILKQGNNQRGIICVDWDTGGGHAYNYKVDNGVIHYIDGQVGRSSEYFLFENPRGYLHHARQNVQYFRTDNLTPNYSKMKKEGVIRTYDNK